MWCFDDFAHCMVGAIGYPSDTVWRAKEQVRFEYPPFAWTFLRNFHSTVWDCLICTSPSSDISRLRISQTPRKRNILHMCDFFSSRQLSYRRFVFWRWNSQEAHHQKRRVVITVHCPSLHMGASSSMWMDDEVACPYKGPRQDIWIQHIVLFVSVNVAQALDRKEPTKDHGTCEPNSNMTWLGRARVSFGPWSNPAQKDFKSEVGWWIVFMVLTIVSSILPAMIVNIKSERLLIIIATSLWVEF